jgi:hypothetical protein
LLTRRSSTTASSRGLKLLFFRRYAAEFARRHFSDDEVGALVGLVEQPRRC